MASSGALSAIYGKRDKEEKKKDLDKSLHSWWGEYAERKNHEDGEAVADSLLYDRNTLPRMAPAPVLSCGESSHDIHQREKASKQQDSEEKNEDA